MKKLLSIIATVAFALTANVAMAAVANTPHWFQRGSAAGGSAYGMCEICHTPHAAQNARRIWRSFTPITSGGAWDTSNVGQLCGQCHDGGSLDLVQNYQGATPSQQGSAAFDEDNHRRSVNVLVNTLGDNDSASNSKPYMLDGSGNLDTAANLECSSCHNPHDDSLRPFLRDTLEAAPKAGSISGFCADCHDRYQDSFEDSSSATFTHMNHPENVPYQNNALNGDTNLHAPADLDATMRVVVNPWDNATQPTWPLGGKFEGGVDPTAGTPTVACVNCHSVHDRASQTVSGDARLHLLAFNNTTSFAGLCEQCHGGRHNSALLRTYSTVGTGGDHPIDLVIDDVSALTSAGYIGTTIIDRWYINDSTNRVEQHSLADNNWPRGGAAQNIIICTSCHSAHRSLNDYVGRLTRSDYTDSIAAGGATAFCNACHASASPLGHHSNKYNAPSQSSLDCGNCHGGSGGSAHNGFGPFTFTDAQNQYSQLCASCHLLGQTNAWTGTPPALRITSEQEATNWRVDPATGFGSPSADHLNASGGVSHYLGSFTDAAASINVKRNAWTYGKSKFGAARVSDNGGKGWGDPKSSDDTTGKTLICESCHSVLWNFGAATSYPATQTSGYDNNLLLQNYQDDSDATATPGAGTIGSGLCIGCHNQNNNGNAASGPVADSDIEYSPNLNVPLNTHPMTFWSITRAQDAGTAPTNLITSNQARNTFATNFVYSGGGTGAKAAGGRSVSYPSGDHMDCDSCHRPHRAAGNPATNQIGLHDTLLTLRTSVPVILEVAGPGDKEYDSLCLECHGY